jgi:hypothetical protein
MNPEQTEVSLLVVKAFDRLRIACFLGASMASSVHGIYRAPSLNQPILPPPKGLPVAGPDAPSSCPEVSRY